MTETDIARRSDALYHGAAHRRQLCDKVAQLEDENAGLREHVEDLGAKLMKRTGKLDMYAEWHVAVADLLCCGPRLDDDPLLTDDELQERIVGRIGRLRELVRVMHMVIRDTEACLIVGDTELDAGYFEREYMRELGVEVDG